MPSNLGRPLAVLLFVVLLATAAREISVVRGEDYEETFELAAADGKPYSATVEILNVHYDETARSFRGTLVATVRGTHLAASLEEAEAPERVTVRHPNSPGEGASRLIPDCTLESTAFSRAPGKYVGGGDVNCGTVDLLPSQAGQEWKYPFDRYMITFQPRICVEPRDCTQNTADVAVESLRVTVAERNFSVSRGSVSRGDGDVSVVLKRFPVIRIASAVLLLMACVSIACLWGSGQRTRREMFADSLGFFAVLWAFRIFLVPASVRSFPTLIDYAVLCLFSGAFIVLLWRLQESRDG